MTDKEAKQFYNSGEWKKKRIEILKRDNYECQDCVKRLREARKKQIKLSGKDRLIRRAEEVHHEKEVKEHPELKLDDRNLTSLCTICHNKRHGRYVNGFVKKKERVTEERW